MRESITLDVVFGPSMSFPTKTIDKEGNVVQSWCWKWTLQMLPSCLMDAKHIFIHIPKCGGSSVHNYYPPRSTTLLYLGHCFAAVYPDWCRSKMFAIVRNPYSRLVSAYRFMQGGGFRNNIEYIDLVKKYPTFEEWVLHGITPENRVFDRGNIVTELLVPQYRFLYKDTYYSKRLIVPLRNILKFENYADEIERHLNIPKQLQLYANVTQNFPSEWKLYYLNKEDVQNKVYALYLEDFELFGYEHQIWS